MQPYTGYIKDDVNFKVLFENFVMLVGNVFEAAYCYNKLTKEEMGIFRFTNDPTCAVVGKNNDWVLIGGDQLVLKTWIDKTLRILDAENIHDFKIIDAYTVNILTDPWAKDAAIWQLQIDLTRLTRPIALIKVKDFKDYFEKPYTDEVIW